MFRLELDRIIEEIKEKESKHDLIQLPAGLKPRAAEIVERIEKESGWESGATCPMFSKERIKLKLNGENSNQQNRAGDVEGAQNSSD